MFPTEEDDVYPLVEATINSNKQRYSSFDIVLGKGERSTEQFEDRSRLRFYRSSCKRYIFPLTPYILSLYG